MAFFLTCTKSDKVYCLQRDLLCELGRLPLSLFMYMYMQKKKSVECQNIG